MKIQNIKTGKESEVTKEGWDTIQKNPHTKGKYRVMKNDPPAEVTALAEKKAKTEGK